MLTSSKKEPRNNCIAVSKIIDELYVQSSKIINFIHIIEKFKHHKQHQHLRKNHDDPDPPHTRNPPRHDIFITEIHMMHIDPHKLRAPLYFVCHNHYTPAKQDGHRREPHQIRQWNLAGTPISLGFGFDAD